MNRITTDPIRCYRLLQLFGLPNWGYFVARWQDQQRNTRPTFKFDDERVEKSRFQRLEMFQSTHLSKQTSIDFRPFIWVFLHGCGHKDEAVDGCLHLDIAGMDSGSSSSGSGSTAFDGCLYFGLYFMAYELYRHRQRAIFYEQSYWGERRGRARVEAEMRKLTEVQLNTSQGFFVQPIGHIQSCFRQCVGKP